LTNLQITEKYSENIKKIINNYSLVVLKKGRKVIYI